MTKGLWANRATASVPRSISVSSLIKILRGDGLKLSLGPLSYTQHDIWERERERERENQVKKKCVSCPDIHFLGAKERNNLVLKILVYIWTLLAFDRVKSRSTIWPWTVLKLLISMTFYNSRKEQEKIFIRYVFKRVELHDWIKLKFDADCQSLLAPLWHNYSNSSGFHRSIGKNLS